MIPDWFLFLACPNLFWIKGFVVVVYIFVFYKHSTCALPKLLIHAFILVSYKRIVLTLYRIALGIYTGIESGSVLSQII
jgi:cadmium resistance protein CadD (predicted permease)